MEQKSWWTSKVVWLNVITILSLALALPDVVAIVPKGLTPYIGAVNAVLNLILRFGTGVPLGRETK
jgi:hypothetical protein